MRLGDLDALKEDLKHRLEIAKTWKEDALNNGHDEIAIRAEATIDFICEVIMTIDNAPTVEQKYYERVIAQINPVIEARPQGEWREKYCDYGVYYRCSNCHKMPPNYECDYKEGAIKTNFCPHCGADMRGGADNDNKV